MDVYAAISGQIHEIFQQFTDQVEPLSLDEAFLDVTGSRELFGDGRAIAERIRREVREQTDFCVSVGVATSKYVAKVASDFDKPDGLVVVEPGAERCDHEDNDCNGLIDEGFDLLSDLEHCGACDSPCAPVHAVPSCRLGQCLSLGCDDSGRELRNACLGPSERTRGDFGKDALALPLDSHGNAWELRKGCLGASERMPGDIGKDAWGLRKRCLGSSERMPGECEVGDPRRSTWVRN